MARSSGTASDTDTPAVHQAAEPLPVPMMPELLQAQVAEAAGLDIAT